jgi:hypothetical protein
MHGGGASPRQSGRSLMMAIRTHSQDRGEQSLLELRRPQSGGVPSREVVGNNQPSVGAEEEIVRARAPPPREHPPGEPRTVEAPPQREDQHVEQDRQRGDEPRGSLLRRRPFTFLIGLILFVVTTTGATSTGTTPAILNRPMMPSSRRGNSPSRRRCRATSRRCR